MRDTAQGEWVGRVFDERPAAGGLPVRVLLDDGREVVATLPHDLPRPAGPPRLGQRVEVRADDAGGPPRVVAFLANRGPRSPRLRVGGWREGGDAMGFIVVARAYTAVDLATARAWLDELRSAGSLDLDPPDAAAARPLGVDLLRAGGGVERAELIYPDGRPAETLAPPPPRPALPCPACAAPLRHRTECDRCGWLRFPGEPSRWGRRGACGQCGFTYRWDGARCSHCGFKAAAAAAG